MRRKNDFAAEMIPIRLIISIAIIAAIALMIGVGFRNLGITSAENQIEIECRTLESKLYTMMGSGVARDVDEINAGDGTKRSITFNLPDSLTYLAFGVDPDSDNDGELETGLTENGSAIFYRVSGGSKHVLWLTQDEYRFREGKYIDGKWVINGDGQGYIITSGGSTTLTFELVQKNHEIYILIQATDTIDP